MRGKKPLRWIFWLSITIWHIIRNSLAKSVAGGWQIWRSNFSRPLGPPTQGVSIRLAPVATHHYIIRDNRFSYSRPLVCLFLYIEIHIGRSICASETIHLCLFVFSITSHNINLSLIMTNDLFPFNAGMV